MKIREIVVSYYDFGEGVLCHRIQYGDCGCLCVLSHQYCFILAVDRPEDLTTPSVQFVHRAANDVAAKREWAQLVGKIICQGYSYGLFKRYNDRCPDDLVEEVEDAASYALSKYREDVV